MEKIENKSTSKLIQEFENMSILDKHEYNKWLDENLSKKLKFTFPQVFVTPHNRKIQERLYMKRYSDGKEIFGALNLGLMKYISPMILIFHPYRDNLGFMFQSRYGALFCDARMVLLIRDRFIANGLDTSILDRACADMPDGLIEMVKKFQ